MNRSIAQPSLSGLMPMVTDAIPALKCRATIPVSLRDTHVNPIFFMRHRVRHRRMNDCFENRLQITGLRFGIAIGFRYIKKPIAIPAAILGDKGSYFPL